MLLALLASSETCKRLRRVLFRDFLRVPKRFCESCMRNFAHNFVANLAQNRCAPPSEKRREPRRCSPNICDVHDPLASPPRIFYGFCESFSMNFLQKFSRDFDANFAQNPPCSGTRRVCLAEDITKMILAMLVSSGTCARSLRVLFCDFLRVPKRFCESCMRNCSQNFAANPAQNRRAPPSEKRLEPSRCF